MKVSGYSPNWGCSVIILSEMKNYRQAIKEQIELMLESGSYPSDIQFLKKRDKPAAKGYDKEYSCEAAFVLCDDLTFPIKLDESDDVSNYVTTGKPLPASYDAIRLVFSSLPSAKIRYERNKKS